MKILVSGSHGMIGAALVRRLLSRGNEVIPLVRAPLSESPGEVAWDPASGSIDRTRLEGMDAAIHLAGERIAGLWTRAKRERIRGSRSRGTRLLSEALAGCERFPRVLVSASAIGYYGNRGDEILREMSPPGSGFLAEVCREWEEGTRPAEARGIRVVRIRTALVLDSKGGLLRAARIPFRLGLGATVGNGRQYMSWVTLADLVDIYRFALESETLSGAIHAASPAPVTNAEFTAALARVLRRPAPLRIPASILRLVLGEMADDLLLASQRVIPERLLASGFEFRHPNLEEALVSLMR